MSTRAAASHCAVCRALRADFQGTDARSNPSGVPPYMWSAPEHPILKCLRCLGHCRISGQCPQQWGTCLPPPLPLSFCMCHGTCKSFHLRAIPARDQLLCVCRRTAFADSTPAADSIRHRPVHAAQVRPRSAAALPTRLALQAHCPLGRDR